MTAFTYDPLDRPANWEAIKRTRNRIEQFPVRVLGCYLDVDELSITRMEEALAYWDTLPAVTDGELAWKQADNTFTSFTWDRLQEVLIACRGARAARGSAVFFEAEAMRDDPELTLRDLREWERSYQ